MKNNKQVKQARRKARVRAKISGTSSCPRLSVFRSNRGMYVQLIDDQKGQTLVSAHSKEIKEKSDKTGVSSALGKLIAEKAIAKKIEDVVFDRSSYRYHGRVKALADGAREGGLKF
jgi:large subunit ribosomal protein L18